MGARVFFTIPGGNFAGGLRRGRLYAGRPAVFFRALAAVIGRDLIREAERPRRVPGSKVFISFAGLNGD